MIGLAAALGTDSTRVSSKKPRSRAKVAAVIVAIILISIFAEVFSYLTPVNSVAGPYTVTVVIPRGAASNTSLNFAPSSITLVIGINNTIQWVNNDPTSNSVHTVTFYQVPSNASASAISSTSSPGLRYGVYFGPVLLSVPGVYRYRCYYNAWMGGTIILKA